MKLFGNRRSGSETRKIIDAARRITKRFEEGRPERWSAARKIATDAQAAVCVFCGHDYERDMNPDRAFSVPLGKIPTKCARCGRESWRSRL